MNRIVKHKWIKQDGFKKHTCNRGCGWTKHYDKWFEKTIYENVKTGKIIYFGPVPRCISLMHCGEI
jgi:hypothetical protein